MTNDIVMKVFLAGEGAVGKTTMVQRYVEGKFNPHTIMTIGVNHATTKILTNKFGQKLILQLWDLGGEDRFRFILPMYIKGSHAGVVCFDSTRYSTYKNLESWLEIIRDILPDTPLILVGTKIDLPGAELDKEKYSTLMEKYNINDIMFTSSKTGENIDELFKKIADYYPQ